MPPPNRKTIAEHKADGTYRNDRHGGKVDAPKALIVPKPPATLTEKAHKYWRSLAKSVLEMRLLAEKDYPALENLALMLYLRHEAQADIIQNGLTYTTEQGVIHRNPSLTTFEKLNGQILQLQKEFALTPLAAQRIDAPPTNDGENDPRNGLFGKN